MSYKGKSAVPSDAEKGETDAASSSRHLNAEGGKSDAEEGDTGRPSQKLKHYDADSEFRRKEIGEMGRELEEDVEKYSQELRASEGFDLDTFPRHPVCGIKSTVDFNSEDYKLVSNCRKAVRIAIEEENKKGANLELVKIIKSHYESCATFYATFKANNKSTGEVKVYQSRVWRNILGPNEPTEVELFRLKPSSGQKGVQARDHHQYDIICM